MGKTLETEWENLGFDFQHYANDHIWQNVYGQVSRSLYGKLPFGKLSSGKMYRFQDAYSSFPDVQDICPCHPQGVRGGDDTWVKLLNWVLFGKNLITDS